MPNELGRETLCCGYKRCPTVVVYDDGSATLTDSGDDGRVHRIELAPDQRVRLAQLLALPSPPPNR